jgi:tetratricopeptide (TPR) repeat protein
MSQASLESSLGMLMSWEGRYAEARQALEHALPLLQGEDRPLPLFLLSETLWSQGEYQRAKRLADEALRLSREVAPSRFTGIALFVLARAETTLVELAEARRHFTQSAAVARSNNHPSGMAAALAGLGQIELNLGRAARATEIYREVLSLCEHYGRQNDMYSAVALVGLGQAAAAMHIFAEAKEYYRRALHVPARLGRTTMEAIAGVAQVMAMDGNSARATELLAFVVAHPYTPHWTRQEARGLLAELTAELPAETCTAATLRGQARELEDVVAEVTSAEPAFPR